jgi:hypothetical protein
MDTAQICHPRSLHMIPRNRDMVQSLTIEPRTARRSRRRGKVVPPALVAQPRVGAGDHASQVHVLGCDQPAGSGSGAFSTRKGLALDSDLQSAVRQRLGQRPDSATSMRGAQNDCRYARPAAQAPAEPRRHRLQRDACTLAFTVMRTSSPESTCAVFSSSKPRPSRLFTVRVIVGTRVWQRATRGAAALSCAAKTTRRRLNEQ